MKVNFVIILIAALIPMLTGLVWYSKALFANAWMKASDTTEEKIKNSNMGKILGLTFVLSFFLAFGIQFMVIHQWAFYSILANEPGIKDPNSEIGLFIKGFMEKYGHNFRTFKHGALHGTIAGIMIALPLIGINALFERKSFKYVAIHVGYWMLTLAIMGGVICQFS